MRARSWLGSTAAPLRSLTFCNIITRYSAQDFEESELHAPLLDDWLEAGDMLYFPRGTIHYGVTCSDQGSHHVTVSTYQKTSWADVLGDALQAALADLAAADVDFRRGMPVNWTRQLGSGVAAGQGLAADARTTKARGRPGDAAALQRTTASSKSCAFPQTRAEICAHATRLLKVRAAAAAHALVPTPPPPPPPACSE